jgi:hypothetical protein
MWQDLPAQCLHIRVFSYGKLGAHMQMRLLARHELTPRLVALRSHGVRELRYGLSSRWKVSAASALGYGGPGRLRTSTAIGI